MLCSLKAPLIISIIVIMWFSSYFLPLILLISTSEKSLVLSCSGDVLPYDKLDVDDWIISSKYIERRYPYFTFSCNSTMCSVREMDYLFHDIAYTFRIKDIVKSLMFMYGSDYIELVEYDETGLGDSYSDGDDDDDDDDGYGESTKSGTASDNGNDEDDTKSSANKSRSNSLSPQIYITLLLCLLTICNYS